MSTVHCASVPTKFAAMLSISDLGGEIHAQETIFPGMCSRISLLVDKTVPFKLVSRPTVMCNLCEVERAENVQKMSV